MGAALSGSPVVLTRFGPITHGVISTTNRASSRKAVSVTTRPLPPLEERLSSIPALDRGGTRMSGGASLSRVIRNEESNMNTEEALAKARRLPAQTHVEIRRGVSVRRTDKGIPVMRLHYSALP